MPWQTDQKFSITISGHELEMQCWGPPPDDGFTLVLLHEGLGCVAMWKEFPQALAQASGCSVLAYSRRGYGASEAAQLPRPVNYMTDEAETDLPAILDHFKLRKVVLIGHSDGASIAAVHGGLAARRIRGLCLMAPHFFTEAKSTDQISTARLAYDTKGLKSRLARYHSDPDNAFNGWCEAWLNPEFRQWNIEDYIDTIRVPVLAIQGLQDEYGSLAQIESLKNRLYAPLDVVLIDDCRHAPHLDQPDKTTGEIADYLRRLIRIEQEIVVLK